MADRWVDEPVPCGDPEIAETHGGMAEPESDWGASLLRLPRLRL